MTEPVRVVDALTGSRDVVNEDLICPGPSSVWVLDGATGLTDDHLTDAPSDAYWLVQKAAALIAQTTADEPRRAVDEIAVGLRDALAREARREPSQAYEKPSAGLAMVSWTRSDICVAALGDCRVLVQRRDGRVVALGGGALSALDATAVAALQKHQRDHGVGLEAARNALLPLIREHRAKMNQPDGYWVLTGNPEAAEHLEELAMPLEHVQAVLLTTDGFYRLVDTFGEHTDETLVSQAHRQGLAALYAQVRALETLDPEGLAHPRFKRHDDATAVLLQVDDRSSAQAPAHPTS